MTTFRYINHPNLFSSSPIFLDLRTKYQNKKEPIINRLCRSYQSQEQFRGYLQLYYAGEVKTLEEIQLVLKQR